MRFLSSLPQATDRITRSPAVLASVETCSQHRLQGLLLLHLCSLKWESLVSVEDEGSGAVA